MCIAFGTWDFTEEAASLAAQGGGELSLTADPIPPAFVQSEPPPFALESRNGFWISFLDVNYPWSHGGESGALTLSVQQTCPKGLSVSVTPSAVRPMIPGATPPKANVEVTVQACPPDGNTPAMVEVSLEVRPPPPGSVDDAGHVHGVRPERAIGKLDGQRKTTCIAPIDAQGTGRCPSLAYQPSQVSGIETIVATAPGFPTAEAKVTVQVPGLTPMPESGLGAWRLTGSEDRHPANHHGTPETLTRIAAMATDYFALHGESLGINDISLELGGLFDIRGNWDPPHHSHRIGKSVDIDRCAQTLVKQRDLDRIAKDLYSGTRTVELALVPPPCSGPPGTPRIHYDFP